MTTSRTQQQSILTNFGLVFRCYPGRNGVVSEYLSILRYFIYIFIIFFSQDHFTHLAAEHFDITTEREQATCRTCKQVLPWEKQTHLGIFNGHLKLHTPEGARKKSYGACPMCDGQTFTNKEVLQYTFVYIISQQQRLYGFRWFMIVPLPTSPPPPKNHIITIVAIKFTQRYIVCWKNNTSDIFNALFGLHSLFISLLFQGDFCLMFL